MQRWWGFRRVQEGKTHFLYEFSALAPPVAAHTHFPALFVFPVTLSPERFSAIYHDTVFIRFSTQAFSPSQTFKSAWPSPLSMRVTLTTPKLFNHAGSKTLPIPHGSSVDSGWAHANKTKHDKKNLQMTWRELHAGKTANAMRGIHPVTDIRCSENVK